MKRALPARLRLDRLLARVSGLGRAQAQRLIRAGEVRVDGKPVTDPGQHVDADTHLEYAGTVPGTLRPRYFMLNKPAGVVCATHDRMHRTVLDLLDVPNKSGLHVAGRLDIDATGLVLITDDGEWSHRITAPRYKLPKSYRVLLNAALDSAAISALERGVQLRNEPKRCAPALIECHAGNEVRITIPEGKYHQVKRMCAAIGYRVLGLHRERIGPVVLDPKLDSAAYRELTGHELALLRDWEFSGKQGSANGS